MRRSITSGSSKCKAPASALANLERLARLLRIVVVALLSFGQLLLVARVRRLEGQRHFEISFGRCPFLRDEIRHSGLEELPPLGMSSDLLLLLLADRRLGLQLGGFSETQLALPLRAADVGEVCLPLHIIPQDVIG